MNFEEWCDEHDGEYSQEDVDGSEFCEWDDKNWVEHGDIYFAQAHDETRVLTNPQEAAWYWDVSAPLEEFEDSEQGLVHQDEHVRFYDTGQTGYVIATTAGDREDDHRTEHRALENAVSELDVTGYRINPETFGNHQPIDAHRIPQFVGEEVEDSPELSFDDGEWV